jgi:asparagine synthase (glutamine-hydrolysing)
MCGVAGVRRFDDGPVANDLLKAMTATIEHRGPDDEGFWTDGSVGFGHRRLSIIDLGGSAQPMASADNRFHVCFNGEIFNYRQLREQLDYPFHTHGDTEVLLALFATQGITALAKLRGQFAFAMYDRETGDLVLARDRLGVLPMYYYADSTMIAFGSEIKALRPALTRPARLDEGNLAAYLMRRAVPSPGTLVEGVRKVPPGHYIHVSATGSLTTTRYWSPPAPPDVLDISDAEAIERVSTELVEAVRDTLVADVAVGSYLSGGVDSSLVVAIASGLVAPRPLKTFAAGFGDARYDETEHARAVSEQFGTDHHEVQVRAADFQQLWQELTWHRDAPVSEPADVAVYRLAQTAREHVKVVLSGEGSDELFGGYPKYRYAAATSAAGVVPHQIRRAALPLFERALPARANRLRIAARAQTGRSAAERMLTWFAPFTAYECEELLGVPVPSATRDPAARDAIDLMGRLDLDTWLPDNLLERGDRMSMAASLELRPPFLDHRLVELAFRLPSRMKVRDGQTKWIVKQVAARYLPASIVQRPKVGFRVPLDSWFRAGLRDLTHDLLLGPDSFVLDVMDGRAVARLVEDHERGRRNEEIRIWTLLSLEVWGRQCLRAGPPESSDSTACATR